MSWHNWISQICTTTPKPNIGDATRLCMCDGGKAAGGGAPRRRTVLLVPEFDWWVPGMRQWVEEARNRFDPGELDAIWVTERRTRISGGYLDRRFAELRAEAGLPEELTLHSLRHSYVTHLIEHGYADRFVQEQVGHQHSSTTSIYTS